MTPTFCSTFFQQHNRAAMGSGESTPSRIPTPPPSPTFRKPWREMYWGEKARDLEYVKNYQPDNTELQHLRILLHGPVGAGKSSFINSVNNILQGRMTGSALVNSAGDNSFTKKYLTYKNPRKPTQKGDRKTFYSVAFTDIMGLEKHANNGVHPEDIKLALKGHVTQGYKFNPVSPLSEGDPGYNSCPTLDDKVHILVCVIPADRLSVLSEEVKQKIRDIREAASDLGIPQLALFTKIDQACSVTESDIKNVYKSKYLKKQMEDFSADVGVPMNCIFPVKNYHSEIHMNDDIDSLILSALRQMVDFGDDFVNMS